MAEVDQTPFSLMSLEDELTCSICLSPFDCPVTIPCGHNFCLKCLLAHWTDSVYTCPQCRTLFPTKPELRKNTVLSTVVDTFNLRSNTSETGKVLNESKEKEKEDVKEDAIFCDTCMVTEASQTCLTCMASFCEEHLRPHRENPKFSIHQLSDPVQDLMERICPLHHKLMELFCSQHGCAICTLCLQGDHKGCPFISPQDQKNQKESDLRGKLSLLDDKISKNEMTLAAMTDIQSKLKDSAANRKKALALEYQQMKDMLVRDESEALSALDRELETGQLKLNVLKKKFNDNVDNMSKAKEEIHSLLSQSQTLAFLQATFNLPQAANFEPHTPRISLDSKKVLAAEASAAALKEHLMELLKQPVETRQLTLKPDGKAVRVSGPEGSGVQAESANPQKQGRKPRSHSPGRPPVNPLFQPFPGQWNPNQFMLDAMRLSGPPRLPRPTSPVSQPQAGQKKKQKNPKKGPQATENKTGKNSKAGSLENLLDLDLKTPKPDAQVKADKPEAPLKKTSAENRSNLLKYGSVLTLDPKTAHKRIALSEDFTVASVSDEQANYPDCPQRFSVCSQVLASKGFSRGRHYWEVKLTSNNFIGLGLAYKSIERKGPQSRLGRNPQSWCVEWFNVKLSAWFNSSETVLKNPNSKRVGVLLDCEEGTATFYSVAEKAYPFHSFSIPFTEAVYPAFWISPVAQLFLSANCSKE